LKDYDALRTEHRFDPPPWLPRQEALRGTNWGDIRAQKQERAEKLLQERFASSHANKLLNDRIAGKDKQRDELGLQKAYGTDAGVSYDSSAKTMYIKGTQDAQDVWDDLKIPLKRTMQSERYQQAEKVYLQLVNQGLPVDTVVGHSLGGAVALEMAKNYGLQSRTYGAPVLDLNPFQKTERYRYMLDPVSILDRAANTSWNLRMNPHGYGGFAKVNP